MQTIKAFFSFKVGLLTFVGVFALASGVLALAPRTINIAKSENCTGAPSTATLNPFPVSWSSETGTDCTDAPAIAVRNVYGGSYAPSADAQNGDELRVRIYVHNGAQQGLDYNQTTAFSVEGGVNISGNQISTDFDGTHADGSLTNTVYGSVSVNIPSGSWLEIIPGSEEFYDYQANRISGYANLNSGSGYFSMGDMQACFEFSKFFVFRVRVVGSTPPVNPNPDPASGSITAQLGARIAGQCLYNGQVSWDSTGAAWVDVTVRNPETGAENLFSHDTDNTGSPTPWLEPNKNYRFTLWDASAGVRQHLAETWLVVPDLDCGTPPPPVETPAPFCSPFIQNVNVGQAANLSASSGTGTYAWSAPGGNLSSSSGSNTSVTYSTAGDKIITVTSGGKSASCAVTVTASTPEPASVVCAPKFQTTEPFSTASFTATGGDGTYSWTSPNDTLQDDGYHFGRNFQTTWASSGRKTVTVHSAGRSDTCEVEVFTPPALVCSPLNQTAQKDQNVVFTASGGVGDYQWTVLEGSPQVGTGSSFTTKFSYAGTFRVALHSGSQTVYCNVNASSTPPPPPPVIPNLVCNPSTQIVNVNQPALFSASGGTGSYVWSAPNSSRTSATGNAFSTSYLTSGTRNVTVTSGTQTVYCSVTVNQPQTPDLICSPLNQTAKVNEFVYFSASGASGTFNWSAVGASPASGNGNSFTAKFTTPGSKSVIVESAGQSRTCNVNVEDLPANGIMELTKTVKNITQNIGFSHNVSAKRNDIVEFKIFVAAGNGVDLRNVRVTDELPFGLSYVENTLKVNGQSHAPGLTTGGLVFDPVTQSGLTITFRMKVEVESGSLVNIARATASNAAARQDQATVNVEFTTPGQPTLSITKEVKNLGPSQVTGFSASVSAKKNDAVQYKITVRNIGNAIANQVFVSDSNPLGISLSGLNVSRNYSGTVQTGLLLGNLAQGEAITIIYNASVNIEQGTVQNIATVSANNASSKQAIAIVNVIKDSPPVNTTGGNCNNSSNSCNNNTNTNTQTNTNSTNSSNQSNNTNINGNNNTVANTNQNCVNNSCNYTNIVYISTTGTTVPGNDYRQLAITKLVRNVNGGAFQDSVSVNNNEIVEFEIVVRNTGNQVVNNAQMTDTWNGSLSLVSGTVRVDGNYANDNLNNISLGNIFSGQQKRVTFQARVPSSGNQSIQNTARAWGDSASQVQDDAWVFVQGGSVQGGNVNLVYSKRAKNETKNVDAVNSVASKEDFITYTLTVTNTGNAPANSFVITDDLSQVLPYADMVDNGGGILSGNIISFPGITVPSGGSVSKSFKVRVKYSLASNLSYTMTNTYGNTITIRINTPQVLGTFVAPKTGGPSVAAASIFGSSIAGALALVRNRRKVWELLWE